MKSKTSSEHLMYLQFMSWAQENLLSYLYYYGGKDFSKKSKISKFSSKNLRISSVAKHLFQPESSIHWSWFCVLYSRFWLSSWYKNFIIIFNPTWSEFFIALKTWWRVEGSGFDSTPTPCCSSADLMLKNGQYIY